MAGISNCASCGHDSQVNNVTGIVTRKNETTGQAEPASVKPAGGDVKAPEVNSGQPSLNVAAVEAAASVQNTAILTPQRGAQAYAEAPKPTAPQVNTSA
ncbi:MAG: hypothetical protein OXR68_06535 [Alphaproteobacteria bacterium]|nr:hypothetical protein [Alphaproteobacteria bacterium]MDD9920260.1 hypothetical protein [Alphaproteobacteria bacterium]